jgi:hypothetical protein
MEAWVTWWERWFLKPAIERECCGKRPSFNGVVEAPMEIGSTSKPSIRLKRHVTVSIFK